MKIRILLGFLSIILWNTVCKAQSTCPYCKGTGMVEINNRVSTFGLSGSRTGHKCTTCGKWITLGTAHTHTKCLQCNGTGHLNGGSSSSRHSYSSSSDNGMVASTDPVVQAWAKAVAYDILYGLPMSKKEQTALSTLNHKNHWLAQRYFEYRNILNNQYIGFNRGYQCLESELGVTWIDSQKQATDKQLAQIAPDLKLPQDLYEISMDLWKKYNNMYNTYRNWVATMEKLKNLENALDEWRLSQ